MALCEKILIAGFSGAGKTSFLREVEFSAPDSSWEFADLDQLILKNRGKGEKNLAKLIELHGWDKFRLWERQEFEGWLKEEGKGVLALGGGTLTQLIFDLYHSNPKIKFCWIDASFEACWERLLHELSDPRPLVQLGKVELKKIFEERQKVFQQIPWRISNSTSDDLEHLARGFWEDIA